MKIIGRTKEIDELTKIYESGKPEFVAMYGRRGVGKSFLVNYLFSARYSFKHIALPNYNEQTDKRTTTKEQLNHFIESLDKYGYSGNREITDWFQAFYALEDLLESVDGRIVVFLDEIQWMDTKGSRFVKAFEAFWNGWANDKNIMLIVCGSSNAWMTKEMFNNYGGLYGRITRIMELLPFTLKECEEYCRNEDILFSRYDIVQTYMVFGGIPYYLSMIQNGWSLPQSIDWLLFNKRAPLKNEFAKLFKSSFKTPELIIQIVRFLSGKSIGYTRGEIVKHLGLDEGEVLSDAFNALSASGFILK